MDYILEMDMLNESTQFDMRTAIIESFELEAIREGFSKRSLVKFFRKIVETIAKLETKLKEWVTKIFGPIIEKYRVAKLKKLFQGNIPERVYYSYYYIKDTVFNAALDEANKIKNNVFKGINFIDSNIDKFLFRKDGNNLSNEKIWKTIKTNKSQLPAPLNEVNKIEDFMVKRDYIYADKPSIDLLIKIQRDYDDISKNVEDNVKQTLQLYSKINERARKYENMMSNELGEDMPGAADIVHCYNIMLKGVSLAANILNSLHAVAIRGISEYCNVANKIMELIGAKSQPASAAS